ncbi:MAG: peptide ABC transporter permease [Theionarchaea archaeon DG-70-1]|nr:MAG: peptide ABC transporter permease [Theionarchaea archaeon DG-70-1]
MDKQEPKANQQKKMWIQNTWELFKETKVGLVGMGILVFFMVMALASFIPPLIDDMYIPLYGNDPEVIGLSPPSLRHPLGTDYFGRDILSQLFEGAKWALIVGTTAAAASVFLGTVIGLVSGYYRGVVDTLLQRTADTVMTLPAFAIIVVVGSVLRGISIWNIVILIAVLGWPATSKVIRAQVLSLRERAFVESALVSGASNFRIMFRHIAPNVLPLSFLYMAFGVTSAILVEAALSFIGMGDPTTVSWGMMLQWCRASGFAFVAPFWMIPPGVCITLLALGFYLIGVGTEQIINPKLRKR